MSNWKLRSCMAIAASMVLANCGFADDGYNLTDGQSIALEANKYITNTVNTERSGRLTSILAAGQTGISTGDYTLTVESSGASDRNYLFNTVTTGTDFTFTGNLNATATGTGSSDNRGLRQNGTNTTTHWNGSISAAIQSENNHAIGIDIWNGSTANFSGDLTSVSTEITGTGQYSYALQNHSSNGSQVHLEAGQTNLTAKGGQYAEAMAVHQGSVYLNGNANITAQNGSSGTRAINVEGDLGNPYDSVVSLKGNTVNVTATSDTSTIGLFSSGSQSFITSEVTNLVVNSTSNESNADGILSQYGAHINLAENTNTTVNAEAKSSGFSAMGVISADDYGYPGHFTSHGNLTANATGVTVGVGTYISNDSSFTADQLTSTGTATGENGLGIGAYVINSTDVVIGSDGKTSSLKGVAADGYGIGLLLKAEDEENQASATLNGVMTIEGSNIGIAISEYSTLTNNANLTVKGGMSNAGTFINNSALTISGVDAGINDGAAIYNEGTLTNNALVTANVTNNGTLNSSADNIVGTVANTGTYNVVGGTIANEITGEGTTNLSGDVVNNASITQSALTNAGTLTNNALITANITNNGVLASELSNIDGNITNAGTLALSGSGEFTNTVSGTSAGVVVLNSDGTINLNSDKISGNSVVINSGTLALGSSVASLYSQPITIGDGATLDIANASAVNVTNLKVAADTIANMAIDFEDTINPANISDVSGNIELTKIDVSRLGITPTSAAITTTIADQISISKNFDLYRGSDLENTPNYITYTKTGTTGSLNVAKISLLEAIEGTAEDRAYQQTQNETIVGTTMTGNLTVKGSGQTVTSDAIDAGGGIQVGSYADTNNELKFSDISFDNIKVNADDKGVFTVEGNNKLVIEADEKDVSIRNTQGGVTNANAIYLKGTGTSKSEAELVAKEDKSIEIADDIRSDNVNNKLILTGDGDIKLKGVLDPLTVYMNAANAYRYNSDIAITWNLNSGILHYDSDSYLSGNGNTINFNGGSLDMMNGAASNISLAGLNVNANSNVYVDVDAENRTMDTFSASAITAAANLNVAGMNIYGTPFSNSFTTTFVDASLGNTALIGHVTSSVSTVDTGVYKYKVSYVDDGTSGKFHYNISGTPTTYFSPSAYASSVAMQGAYLSQLQNYDSAFGNLDQTMLMTQEQRKALRYGNRYAANDETNPQVYSPLYTQNESKGLWFRPYASFEQVKLSGGPDVNNVMYGSLVGGDTEMISIGEKGWEGQISVYAGYNGSHQTFEGIGIYQNGGLVGATAALYKGNFFTALTANVGASSADIKTPFGHNDLTMLTTGIASKTGYNWELCKSKLILQPSWTMSYTFLNPFNNYTMSNGVRIENSALNSIQLVPGIKVFGNLPKGWQPYLGVNMRWNIIDNTNVKASYVGVPETSVDPYVEYGLGVQKLVGDRFTGFGQAMFRGGGRSGVSFTFGFRWALGGLTDKHQKASGTVEGKKLSKKLNKVNK